MVAPMTKLLLFTLVTALTGSPLLALLVLLAVWWLGDRVTFRLLPDPFHWGARWRRRGQLRRALELNPSDRRARFELADLLLESGRPQEAVATLRYNVEAGDDDVYTAFLWGAALGRAGQPEPAERALAVARQADPGFRAGELDLELGRQRLARRDLAGAREALERLVELRPGTVEGRWHLARALEGLGDAAGAARRRREAWAEYVALPRFQRRAQRAYAWRVKPWRPALVALAVALALAVAVSSFGP
jgi:tetratricopeptide (TPR) repeat protein